MPYVFWALCIASISKIDGIFGLLSASVFIFLWLIRVDHTLFFSKMCGYGMVHDLEGLQLRFSNRSSWRERNYVEWDGLANGAVVSLLAIALLLCFQWLSIADIEDSRLVLSVVSILPLGYVIGFSVVYFNLHLRQDSINRNAFEPSGAVLLMCLLLFVAAEEAVSNRVFGPFGNPNLSALAFAAPLASRKTPLSYYFATLFFSVILAKSLVAVVFSVGLILSGPWGPVLVQKVRRGKIAMLFFALFFVYFLDFREADIHRVSNLTFGFTETFASSGLGFLTSGSAARHFGLPSFNVESGLAGLFTDSGLIAVAFLFLCYSLCGTRIFIVIICCAMVSGTIFSPYFLILILPAVLLFKRDGVNE